MLIAQRLDEVAALCSFAAACRGYRGFCCILLYDSIQNMPQNFNDRLYVMIHYAKDVSFWQVEGTPPRPQCLQSDVEAKVLQADGVHRACTQVMLAAA